MGSASIYGLASFLDVNTRSYRPVEAEYAQQVEYQEADDHRIDINQQGVGQQQARNQSPAQRSSLIEQRARAVAALSREQQTLFNNNVANFYISSDNDLSSNVNKISSNQSSLNAVTPKNYGSFSAASSSSANDKVTNSKEETNCSICMEKIDKPFYAHFKKSSPEELKGCLFHKQCLSDWLKQIRTENERRNRPENDEGQLESTCPLCKKMIEYIVHPNGDEEQIMSSDHIARGLRRRERENRMDAVRVAEQAPGHRFRANVCMRRVANIVSELALETLIGGVSTYWLAKFNISDEYITKIFWATFVVSQAVATFVPPEHKLRVRLLSLNFAAMEAGAKLSFDLASATELGGALTGAITLFRRGYSHFIAA